ncbi:sugar phosphate isomerase/epimerase family protein [Agrobacterium radiobacter]|uniref:Xylose isomerase family protein n=1 Tax=Agrobacterium tumefaciens str. B6 TaxID=1183423 RepID=A0A822VBG0_AGRTU|nr:sugar phosphate isomerase/epimerase [Agrobacterium tumefaciens]AYM08372.1 xylose isomerase [Agrobacterium tumefaciens]KWT86011.1 xylose isomerase [Agrobacterium tumefaciens str. B6]NSZ35110.1 sugar phosphate isomerase/epimerase [Agrobacterium tumefaciens]NTA07791.1 sugar phosphate isomerase/epimerase [Agrobacterium tumefaciens]NTA94188.1 sugar phosphate isomerase/epimerase [Agrobacterium tumefaciens]
MKTFKSKLAGMAFVVGLAAGFANPVFADDSKTLPIAAQMYTLRNSGTLEEQLAILNRAGVSAVETVDMQKVSASELNTLLEKHKIKVISSHVPIDKLRGNLDEVITEQKAVGNPVVTVPFLKPEDRPKDAAGWTAFGKELGGYADKLSAAGLSMAYHNHDFEMVKFDGKTALELLLDAAGPKLQAEVDVAWVARSGNDPAEFLGTLKGKVFAIHAKDNAPAGTAENERGFATLGTGILDWKTILPAAKQAGAKWFILEHDLPLDAEAVVTKGNAFLSERLPTIQ